MTVDHVTELELSRDQQLDLPPGTRTARVLVRLHGAPLGFVVVDGPGPVPVGDLLAAGDQGLHDVLAAHRALDDGDPGEVPACRRPGPWPGAQSLVSVVIGTHDRADHLAVALRSLLACSGEFEVIVVDNAPPDDATLRVVEGFGDPRLRYVGTPVKGLSRARNLGAQHARGDILAFTDDDVRIDQDWVQALNRGFTHAPRIGMVTGMVAAAELLTDAQVYFDARVTWSTSCTAANRSLPPRNEAPLYPFQGGDLGTGASLAIRRRVFNALGGFDEALGGGTPAAGGEDLDLFARVLLGGWVLRYEPAALLWHTHRRDLEGLEKQMHGYGTGLTAFLTKQALTGDGVLRLAQGLLRGRGRVAAQQRAATSHALGTRLVRVERQGLRQGPVLYARGRRTSPAPPPSGRAEPDVPVLELLGDQRLPDAGAPLLVTAHGYPLGLLAPDTVDPVARAHELFRLELETHRSEGTSCTWQAELGSTRGAATAVIATTGDRPESLRMLVEQLLRQTYEPLTVLVVDNRPGQWDRRGVLPGDPRVQLVEESVPGVSAARNTALRHVTSPFVLFVDDDVIPSPDWAGWLVAALQHSPQAACATGLILPLETRTRGQRLLEEWGGFAKGFRRQVHRHPNPLQQHPLYPYLPGLFGSGANVGFRADALRELGGYDLVLGAGTPTYGGEDLAVQLDVVLSGSDLVYEPGAVVWHRHRASVGDWSRQLFRYGAALTAVMLRRAGRSPQERHDILKRLPAAAQHALSPSSTKNEHRSSEYPRTLVLLELAGMAYGPVALLRSRRRYRDLA